MVSDDIHLSWRNFRKQVVTVLASGLLILMTAEIALTAGVGDGSGGKKGPHGPGSTTSATGLVRIASVSTSVEGGVLPVLIASFQAQTGLRVTLTKDDDLFVPARSGKFDLLIAHYGHRDTRRFVLDGFGLWPQIVFSNQLALFGPPDDPAKVRGMVSLVQAFRRIAEARKPYVQNDVRGLRYLTDILWHAAGTPAKDGWFISAGVRKKEAIALAEKRGAYVLWGLTPFLREQKRKPYRLAPLVTMDPLLQRVMVSIAVNPELVPGVNIDGAKEFQKFLLAPETQAQLLHIHYPGAPQAAWPSMGRHNPGQILPIP